MSALSDITAGIADIWLSDYVQKNPTKSYKAQYASEYLKVSQYLNGGAEPNFSAFTKLGKGLCEAERARRALVAPPPPPLPPPPSNVARSAPSGKVT